MQQFIHTKIEYNVPLSLDELLSLYAYGQEVIAAYDYITEEENHEETVAEYRRVVQSQEGWSFGDWFAECHDRVGENASV